ncbi:MAG: patatin-like phospholipase family protein [Candidatus Binatia bacterium]
MTTAFVLSGGGSLGAVQVGMLQALSRAGIRPDLLVGCSVGALNASWVAGDPAADSIDGLARLWRSLSRGDVFPIQPVHGLLGFLGYRSSMLSDSGLRRLLKRYVAFRNLEDSPIPLHVVACDVLAGREVLLSRGPAVEAILASAAIPGVFPPVTVQGRACMDGGILDNTPISHAHDLGADTIWVLPAGYACALPRPPTSSLGMALHGLSLALQQRLAIDIARFEPIVDLRVVPPLCPVPTSPADFSQAGALIDGARDSTEHWLRSLCPHPTGQALKASIHSHG